MAINVQFILCTQCMYTFQKMRWRMYSYFWYVPHIHIWTHKCVLIPLSIIFLVLPLPLHFPSSTHSISPFAISICSNEIYLTSRECPSAMRDNISYKYHLSSHGSCNIYKGNVAVGDINNVYHEQVEHPSKVHWHLPTFWQARCLANSETHLHVTQRSQLTWSHLACLSNPLIMC